MTKKDKTNTKLKFDWTANKIDLKKKRLIEMGHFS
jgi:hypothetical protein